MEKARGASKRKSVEDEPEDLPGKRSRADDIETVAIVPSTDFATKILPRAITEVTALAELVDNAIEACINNVGSRLVTVTYDQQAATLAVEDNGSGIDANRVTECFSLGHSERSATNIENAAKNSDKFDARSNFSRHGVGAKTAVFKLCRKAEILTRTVKDQDATLLVIDMAIIEKEKKWQAHKGLRKRASPGTTIKIYLTEAATYALRSTSDVAAYLAQLYYFHIAGVPDLLNEEVPMKTTTITYNGVDLLKYPNRLTNFLAEAKKDYVTQMTMKISMSYKPVEKATARHETETAVMHIYLFYFPSIHGRETRPTSDYSKSPMLDNHDSIFWFWQARYLSETHSSLPILQRQMYPAHGLPIQIWDRIMGLVILPSVLTTSDYKTNIWSEDQIWKKIHNIATYSEKMSDMKDWLKSCHMVDEEILFLDAITKPEDEIQRFAKIEFPAPGGRKKGEKPERLLLSKGKYFRYKSGDKAGQRTKVGKVSYFYNDTEPKSKDSVVFFEVLHRDAEKEYSKPLPISEILEVLSDRQVANHTKDMMPKAIVKHNDPEFAKNFAFPIDSLKADQKVDFGVQIARVNGDLFKPLDGEIFTIEISISDRPIAPWSCSSNQAKSHRYWFSVKLRTPGKYKISWTLTAPSYYKVEPLIVDFVVATGEVKYVLPDFNGAVTQRACVFGEPFEVRMLKCDSADAPVSFEKSDESELVTVEVYRAQKQPQPMYTLQLANVEVAKDEASLAYLVGNVTINRVGPNEEELTGAETLWIGFAVKGLVTRPVTRLAVHMNSGPVGSIRFEPSEPVPAVMRFGEALPTCKVTLLDTNGSPLLRGAKKIPLIKIKSDGVVAAPGDAKCDEHGLAELPHMTVSAPWGTTGTLTIMVVDHISKPAVEVKKEFGFSVPPRVISLRHADLESGNTFNVSAGKAVKDIKVQIDDEMGKVDASYNGELSLVYPDKEQKITIPIANGRGVIKELKITEGGTSNFVLGSSNAQEHSGLQTNLTVNVSAGPPAKLQLAVKTNGKEAVRLHAGQRFTLVVRALDSFDIPVLLTDDLWVPLRDEMRLQVRDKDSEDARDLEYQRKTISLVDGAVEIGELALRELAGAKEFVLHDRRRPLVFSEPGKYSIVLTHGHAEILSVLPSVAEIQSGAAADLTIEVQDCGGNAIAGVHGSLSCISDANLERLSILPFEEKAKGKRGASTLGALWRISATSAPRPDGVPVTITARLTAPQKKDITQDISLIIKQSHLPASIEVIEPGRPSLAAGSSATIKVMVRKSDKSIYTNPKMRAVLHLNATPFRGTVGQETITFENVVVPAALGSHMIVIELSQDSEPLLKTMHNFVVDVGEPAKLELLSPMRQLDSKSPNMPPVVLKVTDSVGNTVVTLFHLEITAVSESATNGILPSLVGSPVIKRIQGQATFLDLKFTHGVTSSVHLRIKVVEHPNILLDTPTFTFQGEVQVSAAMQQKTQRLNKLRDLNLEVEGLQRKRDELSRSARRGGVPLHTQQRLEELKRRLEEMEKQAPEADALRKAVPPSLPLELQPSTRAGVLGPGVTLGKVADPTLAALLVAYSGDRLRTVVIEKGETYKRLRSHLGDHNTAFVLEQNTHRAAKDEWLTPEGFIKFSYQPSTRRYVGDPHGQVWPKEEGMLFLVNTIQCTPALRKAWWFFMFHNTLLFDTTERLDAYLQRNGIAAQNMLSLSGNACVDGIHKRIRAASHPIKFAAPTAAERNGDGTRLLPQFSNCLLIGQQYRDALTEFEQLQQQVANVEGDALDSRRIAGEVTHLESEIFAKKAEITRLQRGDA